jgi:integrase
MAVRKRTWKTVAGQFREGWVVDYADAQGDRHIRTFQRKRDADAYFAKVSVDVRAGTHTAPSKSIVVEEAAQNWIESVALDDREESTLAQYRQHAVHINNRIGNIKLAELTAPKVGNFRDDLLKTMSRAMARKVLTSLKSLLRHAQANGEVAQNVALAVKIKTNPRDKRKLEIGVDIPTVDEIKAIIGAATATAKPLLLTAIFAGLRASELRGLRWSDVDLKNCVLHVRQRADRYGKIGSPKSKAGHRTVPLAPQIVQALREWKLQCPKGTGLVFPAVSGTAVALHNNTVRAFTAAVRAAGVVDQDGGPKYTGLHALRHFYASWCINPKDRGGLGLSAKVVQELLGHSSIAMTMDTYGHLFPARDDVHARLAEAAGVFLDAT